MTSVYWHTRNMSVWGSLLVVLGDMHSLNISQVNETFALKLVFFGKPETERSWECSSSVEMRFNNSSEKDTLEIGF